MFTKREYIQKHKEAGNEWFGRFWGGGFGRRPQKQKSDFTRRKLGSLFLLLSLFGVLDDALLKCDPSLSSTCPLPIQMTWRFVFILTSFQQFNTAEVTVEAPFFFLALLSTRPRPLLLALFFCSSSSLVSQHWAFKSELIVCWFLWKEGNSCSYYFIHGHCV